MFGKTRTVIAAVTAGAMLAVSSLAAAPVAEAKSGAHVMHRGGNWHGHGNWHGGGCWNCGGWGWGGWWGPAVGFGTGLLVRLDADRPALLSAPTTVRATTRPRYRSGVAYCQSRFRSYNVYTRTYTGYDGLQHRCG